MAKNIVDIPRSLEQVKIKDLTLGRNMRSEPEKTDIKSMANSIRLQGLHSPVLVNRKTMEVIAGQCRFLACVKLELDEISAFVYEDLTQNQIMEISTVENLIRTEPSTKDKIDACTEMYKRYGSYAAVSEAVGISATMVSKYVKYDALPPRLKDLVDNDGLDINVALSANRAAMVNGKVDEDRAVKFAAELRPLNNKERSGFVSKVEDADPDASDEDLIELGRSGDKLTDIVVTFVNKEVDALSGYASDNDQSKNESAHDLAIEGLTRAGKL